MSVDLNFNQRKTLEALSVKGAMPIARLNLSRGDCSYLQNKGLIKVPAVSKGRWIEISDAGRSALGEAVELREQVAVTTTDPMAFFADTPAVSQGWTAADIAKVSAKVEVVAQAPMTVPAPRVPSASLADMPNPGRGVPLSVIPKDIYDPTSRLNDPLTGRFLKNK